MSGEPQGPESQVCKKEHHRWYIGIEKVRLGVQVPVITYHWDLYTLGADPENHRVRSPWFKRPIASGHNDILRLAYHVLASLGIWQELFYVVLKEDFESREHIC